MPQSTLPKLTRWAVAVVSVIVTATSLCRAGFLLPNPALTSPAVVGTVRVACSGAGRCGPSEASCAASPACDLECPTRSLFPATQFPFNTSAVWARSATSGCQITGAGQVDGFGAVGKGLLSVNGTAAPGNCSVRNAAAPTPAGRLSVAMWLYPQCSGLCTLVRIEAGAVKINLTVNNGRICIQGSCGSSPSFSKSSWLHLVLQVGDSKASVSVNGAMNMTGETVVVPSLPDSVTVTLGTQVTDGALGVDNNYQMFDAHYYSDLLTFREIQQLFSNSSQLADAGERSECRCPHSHPTLKNGDNYACVNEAGQEVKRLRTNVNLLQTLVNTSSSSQWMAGPRAEDITFTLTLRDQFQVEEVEVRFAVMPDNPVVVSLPSGVRVQAPCSSSNCVIPLTLNPADVTPEKFNGYVADSVFIHVANNSREIVITSIVITVRCNCNGNAADCTASTLPYQCLCEPSTMTNGRQCHACQPNNYRLATDFDCPRPCVCDSTGVANTSHMCNTAGGACICKSNHSSTSNCSECHDNYYRLNQGCVPCQCTPMGSNSTICDQTTGQCPCLNGATTDRTCSPVISSLQPTHGPVAGGTEVTVVGRLLGGAADQPEVFLGSAPQNVLSANATHIVFRTASVSGVGVVRVNVSWDQSLSLSAGDFSYRPNPVLNMSSVPSEVAMFISGGCAIRLKGSNLNNAALPRLVVNDTSTGRPYYGPKCRVLEDLHCMTPDLREEVTDGLGDLRFGLELDGVIHHDLGPVEVNNDPRLDDLGDYNFQYPFETTVVITGAGLTGGCRQSEMTVRTGIITCDIVSLSDSQIECRPPRSLLGSKGLPIEVEIGSNIARVVGRLNYLQFWETTYFIGIMCGIGAFIVLIIVLVVFCCCRRHGCKRVKVSKRDSRLPLGEKADNSRYSAMNDYSQLPQQTGSGGDQPAYSNPGFQQDSIRAESVLREPKDAPPPTAPEVDQMALFLKRVEHSLWDSIQAAMLTANCLTPGRVCTNKGTYARITDGQFTTVTAGQKTEKKVTIKTLKNHLPEEGVLPMWATTALREALRLHRLSDDNVLSIMGLALDGERFHIIYPYMHNRTLKDHILDVKKDFSVRQLVEYGLQAAEGLVYLHGKDIVHRDIATRNCMVSATEVVKISDAAFAWDFYKEEYVYDSERERYLPVRWMAPESLSNGFYSHQSDIWSLGVLLWELLTRGGCLPYHEVKDEQVRNFVRDGYVLGKPENCSDQLYEMMHGCWQQENEQRPSISRLNGQLGQELTGEAEHLEDVYINLGTVEGYYQNQEELGKPRRMAPQPPR